MHYLLNDQSYYFPSSNDQSSTLQQLLEHTDYHLPIIIRISSSNIHERSIQPFLSKTIPLLLLKTYQFQSILSEYHTSNDGKHRLTQGKLLTKKTTKYHTMKKLSKSLVTVAGTTLPNDDDHHQDDEDYFNTRTIVRNLNERRSMFTPLCRVPLNYHGFFELLNENNQAIEPFHQVSDLLIVEYNNEQVRTEKWPEAFFLRSTCKAYTKRYILDDGKLSGSADSCYGSLSDLDSYKNLLILNDNQQMLQSGQKIMILNQCSAYRSQLSEQDVTGEQVIAHSSTSSWLRNKSRFFFPRKKSHSSPSSAPPPPTVMNTTKNIYDIPRISQPYLKCQIEQGDIVYISIYETGLFSPLHSQNHRSNSKTNSEHMDISGVFQLKELLSNFRFPISVRLLNHSVTFNNIYSPASIQQPSDSSLFSANKFRLLLPYTEDVIFACPLILPSSLKSQIIVIPIPLTSDVQIQRCLNMREITKNRYFHNLIQKCSHIIEQYQTEFAYIHFPLILSAPTKQLSKRKEPLFKKRSQSESHIEYHAANLTNDLYRKSCDVLNHDKEESATKENQMMIHEQVQHRTRSKTNKPHLSNPSIDNDQLTRRSSYYTKLKIDKPRQYSRQQELDSDDENYRELDHIYDYIRSGDITDDVQKIQAKEQALNTKYNQINNIPKVCVSPPLNGSNPTIKSKQEPVSPTCDNSKYMKIPQYPHNLDDSRPFDNDSDDDDDDDQPQTYYSASRRNTLDTLPDATRLKSIIRMKRISKH